MNRRCASFLLPDAGLGLGSGDEIEISIDEQQVFAGPYSQLNPFGGEFRILIRAGEALDGREYGSMHAKCSAAVSRFPDGGWILVGNGAGCGHGMVLDPDMLTIAIDIQAKSYRLLRWVGQAVDEGRLPAGYAANHSNDPSAASDWLTAYFDVLPTEMLPERPRTFGLRTWIMGQIWGSRTDGHTDGRSLRRTRS